MNMPEVDNAVEAVIFKFGGMLFSRVINPLIIIWVAVAIALFLYIIFKSFYDSNSGKVAGDAYKKNLFWPIIGLTIMLSAIGIATFIGNTGNEIFQGPAGAGAVNGIREVTRPIEIR